MLLLKISMKKHRVRHLRATDRHICEICDLSFNKLSKLATHMKSEHQEPMKCLDCEKTFSKVHSYVAHMRNHNKMRDFTCNICSRTFKLNKVLKVHKLLRHGIGDYNFNCSICGKGFLSRPLLRDHGNQHSGNKPHQCEHCGTTFAKVKALEAHLVPCLGGKWKDTIFRCKVCNRVYRSKGALKSHTAVGNCIGNICKICGRHFSFQGSLLRHQRTHSNETPLECSICRRKFKCLAYLKTHQRTHSGERPYRCRFCWKMFTQRSSCSAHESIHNKSERVEEFSKDRHKLT